MRTRCRRLIPHLLHSAASRDGVASLLARSTATESSLLTVRISFGDCIASYNPLGKFGASWSSDFSEHRGRDR